MSPHVRRWIALPASLLVLLAGCGGPPKLSVEKSFSVDFFNNFACGPDILPKEQVIKVEVTAESPVKVFFLTGINEVVAVRMTDTDLAAKAVIAKTDVTAETVTFKIPADTQGVIVVTGRGASNREIRGTVKMSN